MYFKQLLQWLNWLNAAALITFVPKISVATIQITHYTQMLKNDNKALNYKIDCGTTEVQQLLQVRHLTESIQ